MRVVQDFGELTPVAKSSHLISILKDGGSGGDPDSRRRWCRNLSIDRLAELCFAGIVGSRAAFPVCRCSLLPCLWHVPHPGEGAIRSLREAEAHAKAEHRRTKRPCDGGIGRGRTLMWHEVEKSRWHGAAASHMYTSPLLHALQNTWPQKRRWDVLEDNDPKGFKSGAAVSAKAAVKIAPFSIPPRSPDLNPCDFALWKEITKRMRQQELKWKSTRRDTRY